jgi:hypothetical protein
VTLADLVRMIGVNSAGPWTQTSAALLDMLRQFAREGRLHELSEAYRLALDAHPDATAFLSHAIVAILLSEHKPLHQVATQAQFAIWCEQNPGWHDRVRLAALDPESIAAEMERLTASVRKSVLT